MKENNYETLFLPYVLQVNFSTMPPVNLNDSLHAALRNPYCVNASWMHKYFNRLKRCDNKDSFYWIDDDNCKICMAFPAILDIHGPYERHEPYFSLADCKSVCHFPLISIIRKKYL
jgi:hypothetical protein